MFSVKKYYSFLGFIMKADKRLETLCEEFTELDESEKDTILEFSKGLAHSASIKSTAIFKTEVFKKPHFIKRSDS
jgi:hypothetical protein